MNPIKIACPKCHRTYKIEEKLLGKKVTCATEGCGTKFIAELPSPPDETSSPTKLAVAPSSRPPSIPPVPSDVDENPFGDVDFEPFASDSRTQPTELSDEDFLAAPPPLPKRRTTPSVPAITNSSAPVVAINPPKPKSSSAAVTVFTLLCVAIVGVSAWIGLNFFFPGGIASSAGNQLDAKTAPLADLLYLTDTVMRLAVVTDDPSLVKESLAEWVKQRKEVPKSDETEISLGVIEGHLGRIFDTLYVKGSSDEIGFMKTARLMPIYGSVDAIRTAQSQLMHAAKIPWKVAQRSDLVKSTYSNLLEEVRQVAADSAVGSNNLPTAISPQKCRATVRKLNLLFAKVPLAQDSSKLRQDEFSPPAIIDMYDEVSTPPSVHWAAVKVLRERAQVPVAKNTLDSKTEILQFSEHYKSTLNDLNHIIKRWPSL